MGAEPRSKYRAATLADVAREAGVSIATASYVLSNRDGVTISAPTRDRVNEAATRLKYRRNALAAALRSGTRREIGIFVGERPRGVIGEIVFACIEIAQARGLATTLCVGANEHSDPGPVEGAIVIGSLDGSPHPRLLDGSLPVAEIGGLATHCQIRADDFGGARRAVEHLLALGHRRIAHYAGPQNLPAYQERLRGFLDAVHEGGLRMDASPVVHTDHDLVESMQPMIRPTALVTYNDHAAASAYRRCREIGLTIPNDLSIVGFDDDALAAHLDPPLTTLRVSPELMAGSAFELLERQIAHETVPSQTLAPTELIVRSSTSVR